MDYSNIPRDSRRVPLETRVQFKFDRFDGFISEYSSNISPGGLFLRTRAPQPPGTVLDFELRLGDGFELIRGSGEVIWNRLEDEGPARPAGMGLRFLELSEGSKELIYRIVDQHVLQGGTPFDVTQRPPDPVPLSAPPPSSAPWPRPAPLTSKDVFDLPPPPAASPAASSWLPSLDEHPDLGASPAGEPFPDLISQTPPAPAPDAPPMFAPTFGHAAAASARPRRRMLPWVLLAVGVLLAAGLFLLRDRVMGWVGLGGGDEIAQTPPPQARPKKPRRVLPGAPGAPAATPEPSAAPPAAATPASPASPPPLAAAGGPAQTTTAPSVAPAAPAPAPKAPPAPAAGSSEAPKAPFPAVPEDTGPPLTALEKITFEVAGGGTDVILWGNGAIPASVYTQSRIDGNPPRELFRLSGLRQPFGKPRLVVGTPELLQIRTGFHSGAHGNEVHVVLDLANPSVKVTQVEPGPQRLRIHLQRK